MKAVIQRVNKSKVVIGDEIHSIIDDGLLILLGIKKGDTEENAIKLANKIINLRIFNDENGKMNHSVVDIKGEILIISQFTLCTDNEKSGNRPGFTSAEEPIAAKLLYEKFCEISEKIYEKDKIKRGIFAADMKVELINDGPVTIILEK